MVVKRGQAGITLIELIIAVSMSSVVVLMALSLFKDFGFAARLTGGRRDAVFRAQAAFESMAENFATGRGILGIAPGRAELLNRRNQRIVYAWGDSVLSANGVPFQFSLASLRFEAQGPRQPAWKPFAGNGTWELDSLDENHDGRLDSAELDRDGDGELDAGECRLIAALRLTLVADFRGTPIVLTALVHPRNRVADPDGAGKEGDAGSGGIPDP